MAVTFSDNAIISSLVVSALLLTVICFPADAAGFSIQLIHRDSPDSPFLNPSETHDDQRLTNSLARSSRRARRLTRVMTTQNPAQYSTVIAADDGDYLVKVLVGTPPVAMFLVADTSSDITWMQCKSCSRCYNQTSPLFDPSASSTYRQVSCESTQCLSLPTYTCEFYSDTCIYQTLSLTGISVGIVSEDSLSLTTADGQLLSLPNTTFGCGIYNFQDSDVNTSSSGVVGLGPAMSSLFFQMLVPSFSYCLVPVSSTASSKLNFGAAAVKGAGVVSTPLYWRHPNLFYSVNMEAISIQGERLPFQTYPMPYFRGGNTIIDSGSALTYLPEPFYEQVEYRVSNLIQLQRVQDPVQKLSLCYKTESDFRGPNITVHFDSADVELSSMNTFIIRSGDVVCLAFGSVSGNDGSAIYGNRQQMNFFIEFDIERGILSFEPTDCTKF